jgi:predicted Zn-dependent protease
MLNHLKRLRCAPLLLACALLTACGSAILNPVTGAQERSVMDERSEIAAGAKGHAEVLKEYAVLPDAKVQAYVNDLGQRLAKLSHRQQLQWHFTVLDSPEINAFALPGGYVYVTRGIMAYLQTEAELAGVMGHEIGHVTARHGAQRATRAQDAGLGVLAATVLGAVLESQGIGGAGRLASDVSQTVASGWVASYGREQELQADRLGAEYLARTAFDPRTMIRVIGALKSQERFAADQARAQGQTVSPQNSWLASHPSNDQRLQLITQLSSQYQGSYQDEGRERFLAISSGLTFGDSAEQGLVRGQHFYHPKLGFALTAPTTWTLQNNPDHLAIVNSERSVALLLQTAPAKAGQTHDEVIRNLLRPTQGQAQRKTINGMPATYFAGKSRNAQGAEQFLDVNLITGPNRTIYLLRSSAKDPAVLQRNQAQLQQAIESFRPLQDAERLAARPWQLKTVLFPSGGFAELARRSSLPKAEQQLRLINGFYEGGMPPVGSKVKVVD